MRAWSGTPRVSREAGAASGDSSSPNVEFETPDSVPGVRGPGWAGRSCGQVTVRPGDMVQGSWCLRSQ